MPVQIPAGLSQEKRPLSGDLPDDASPLKRLAIPLRLMLGANSCA